LSLANKAKTLKSYGINWKGETVQYATRGSKKPFQTAASSATRDTLPRYELAEKGLSGKSEKKTCSIMADRCPRTIKTKDPRDGPDGWSVTRHDIRGRKKSRHEKREDEKCSAVLGERKIWVQRKERGYERDSQGREKKAFPFS